MKFTVAAVTVASVLSSVTAAPLGGLEGEDVTIAQLALTLEHLESAFYSGALKKFDEEDFKKAGMPNWARGRFTQVAAHEATHVDMLTSWLGPDAVAACTYTFPYHDVKSFAALSQVLEGVGVSAYLGAASSIEFPPFLTAAAGIMSTEARHQAWLNSAISKAQPWSAPEDTPLSFSQVYTLASAFITSCPQANPTLPFTAFPKLSANVANAKSGATVTYNFAATGDTYYAVYYYGLGVTVVPLNSKRQATVPAGMVGTYYTIITTSPSATVTDENTVAGPLIATVNFGN